MVSSRSWRPPKRKRDELLRLGGEQCAICHRNLRARDHVTGKVTFIADAAHMYPHSDRGERGDPAHRPALVDDISNLLMLCPNCHRLVDWEGVGGRLFTLGKLRTIKREHEAWIEFLASRPEFAIVGIPGPEGVKRGQSVTVDGRSYRLPWDERPGRVDSAFSQEWSPARDAVRCQSYAYAESGTARHAWLRRIEASEGAKSGERWRRELAHEASLLCGGLPSLPGLPSVLGVDTLPKEPFALVTALPSATSMLDRYRTASTRDRPGVTAATGPADTTGPAVMTEESVRMLFAGLPALCAALGALHDAGLAHGALDPRAILVDQSGNLVLRDLGRATAEADGAADDHGSAPGKPAKSGDVSRLAAIVYEAVTGVRPLTGADGPPVPASVYNPFVPDQAATALTQALAGDIVDARALARRLCRARPRCTDARPSRTRER